MSFRYGLLSLILSSLAWSVLATGSPAVADVSPAERTQTGPVPLLRFGFGLKPIYAPLPKYPKAALRACVQGDVLIEARIDPDGRADELKVISGHPLLVPAALDAAKQWLFQPLGPSARPARRVTTIKIPFRLSRSASPCRPQRIRTPSRVRGV